MITVHPRYEQQRDFLVSLPEVFGAGDVDADGPKTYGSAVGGRQPSGGRLLYNGRNQIRLFTTGGQLFVVKRYKRHNWLKSIVYTFFRKNKALRSYENARRLRERGFATPHEVAYVEQRHLGLIRQVYYVCEYTDAQAIRPPLIEQEPFDRHLATDYARYVARLHEAGVLHRDLNPTNVLFRTTADGYAFELIDINRMRFYDGPVPKGECMENLTLFWWLTDVYRFVLSEYSAARGWTAADQDEAVRVKQRHDRAWVRRKRLTHPFRK